MNTLIISPHFRCVAHCRHCGVEAGPKDERQMDDDVVRAIVREACDVPELKIVSFYGGEPMLRADFILEQCSILSAHHKAVMIYTNGFWGITEARAREWLERMRTAGVVRVVLSADQFHSEFVPLERVRNVLRARSHVPEIGVTLSVVDTVSVRSDRVIDELDGLLDGVDVFAIDAVPIGRATTFPESEFSKNFTSFDALPCPEVGLNYSASGVVTACPALEAIVQLPSNRRMEPILSLGSPEKMPVARAVELVQERPIFRVLKDEGPGWFVARFREAGIPEFQNPVRVGSACELCMKVFVDPDHLAIIARELEAYKPPALR